MEKEKKENSIENITVSFEKMKLFAHYHNFINQNNEKYINIEVLNWDQDIPNFSAKDKSNSYRIFLKQEGLHWNTYIKFNQLKIITRLEPKHIFHKDCTSCGAFNAALSQMFDKLTLDKISQNSKLVEILKNEKINPLLALVFFGFCREEIIHYNQSRVNMIFLSGILDEYREEILNNIQKIEEMKDIGPWDKIQNTIYVDEECQSPMSLSSEEEAGEIPKPYKPHEKVFFPQNQKPYLNEFLLHNPKIFDLTVAPLINKNENVNFRRAMYFYFEYIKKNSNKKNTFYRKSDRLLSRIKRTS